MRFLGFSGHLQAGFDLALEHAATEHFTAGAAIVVVDFAAVTAFPSALFTRLHQLDAPSPAPTVDACGLPTSTRPFKP